MEFSFNTKQCPYTLCRQDWPPLSRLAGIWSAESGRLLQFSSSALTALNIQHLDNANSVSDSMSEQGF